MLKFPPQACFTFSIILVFVAPRLTPHAQASSTPSCRPEGRFQPDTLEGPPADSGGLAVCHNYSSCSCCNFATSAIIFNSIKAVLIDPDFSERCKRFISIISCRICDPLVGIGQRPTVCRNLCNGWFDRCLDEFFAFQPTTGRLIPCVTSGQQTLLCTQMREIARNGSALCSAAGLTVSDDMSQCYNGNDAPMLDSCRSGVMPQSRQSSIPSSPPPRVRRKAAEDISKKQSKKSAKARKKKAAGAKYSTADLVLLTLAAGGAAYCSRHWLLTKIPGWATKTLFPGAGRRLGSSSAQTSWH